MVSLGLIHLIFGGVSLLTGGVVVLTRKGTRFHRTLGHLYLASMIGVNVTGLSIYRLTGAFNYFHVFALASLASIILGLLPALVQRPKRNWLRAHGSFMSGSYVGLVAAAVSEVTSRVPGWDFGVAVGATTILVSVIGVYLIHIRMDSTLAKTGFKEWHRKSHE